MFINLYKESKEGGSTVSKLMKMGLALVITIAALGGVGAYLFIFKGNDEVQAAEKPLSAKEMAEYSVKGGEEGGSIVTNLYSPHYVVVNYTLIGDGKEAKEELETKLDVVKSLYISTLSGMKADDLKGPEKLHAFEDTMQTKINEILEEGKVVDVLTTDLKVQDAQ